ncbi:MAG TPA: hypothetical protein VFZ53_24595 [Polyangiaceae bacterium]
MRWAFAGFLKGFTSFVEGARLLWTLRGLRRLTLASTLVTLYFLATVLLLLEGFERGRLVALGDASRAWSTALMVWSVFALLFTFPVLGPISSALQGAAAERTRAAFAGLSLPPAAPGRWFFAVLGELMRFHARMLMLSLGAVVTVLAVVLVVPENMPRLRGLLSLVLSLSLFALSALFRGLRGTVPRAELLKRWPEVAGFVLGSWCLTLFALGPWFVVLNVVSAEVFRARLRNPDASVNASALREPEPNVSDGEGHAARHGRIPSDVAHRVRRRYESVERTLTWDAEPPKNVRYEYLALRSDPRPGEYQIGALLPTNEDDTLRLTEPIRFWVVVSERAPDDGRYRRFMDDRFAGPLEA